MSPVASSDIMYRLLIQSVVDYAIYMLTPDGVVANWNPGAQRAKGYSADEVVGKHYSLFYEDQDRAAGLPEQNLEQARRTGRFEEQGWRVCKDGSAFRAHVVIDAVRDEQGQLLGFAKVTRDISERHRYELELLEAKVLAEQYSQEMANLSRFLDSVIANIPASVIVQDLDSQRILLANQQAERLFGSQGASMIGRLPGECLLPGAAEYLQLQLANGARSTKGYAAETRVETARGPRTLRSRALLSQKREGQADYVMFVAEDATEELAAHAQIHHMAHHDALTGLPNRMALEKFLPQAQQRSRLQHGCLAILYLDLDAFKPVNDTYGHVAGDHLLREIAQRLRGCLRDGDLVARLGGDEFLMVLQVPAQDAQHHARLVAERAIAALGQPVALEVGEARIGCSIGGAIWPVDHADLDSVLQLADEALYQAKDAGRNRAVFHVSSTSGHN